MKHNKWRLLHLRKLGAVAHDAQVLHKEVVAASGSDRKVGGGRGVNEAEQHLGALDISTLWLDREALAGKQMQVVVARSIHAALATRGVLGSAVTAQLLVAGNAETRHGAPLQAGGGGGVVNAEQRQVARDGASRVAKSSRAQRTCGWPSGGS